MIELKNDQLAFSFPEVHPGAHLSIDFQRTLRIPDDHTAYALPPGLGRFPVRHVDDFAARIPGSWSRHGGVMLPMYQAEALWLNFGSGDSWNERGSYPFAVKIATGKINAVTGEAWADGLNRDPQDYVVTPNQPWLDGYCVEKGVVRQFVAMPLGKGYTAEEQLTGDAEFGGIQIVAYPMKREVYERRFPEVRADQARALYAFADSCLVCESPDMGMAPGGRMRQEIFDDEFDLSDWDLRHSSRCFVHLANARSWAHITGSAPPTKAPTAADYTKSGLPWFEYYGADQTPVEGSSRLAGLDSVLTTGKKKGETPLPENESTTPIRIYRLGSSPTTVREGTF